MSSTRRWSVSHRRVVISVVLAVIGVFILCGAAGLSSFLFAAIGVAVIAGSAGLFALSALNSRAYSFIPGRAHVVSASEPPSSTSHGRCQLHLVVHARDIPGLAVKIRDAAVPVSKWPDAGTTLPILVAVDNPHRVRVLWDEVPVHGQTPSPVRPENASDGDYGSDADDDATDDVDMDTLDDDDSLGGDTFDDDGLDDDDHAEDLVSVGVTEMRGGGRVIELDVMDPSLVRWSAGGDSTGGEDTATARTAADMPTAGTTTGQRRRPSPRPRPAVEETIVSVSFADPDIVDVELMDLVPGDGVTDESDAAEFLDDVVDAELVGDDEKTTPLRVQQARVVTPAVSPTPDTDGPFDQHADPPALASAYLAATPPPGTNRPRPGRIRSVSVTLFVTDLSRSIVFYRDLLGFQEIDAGHGSAVLESGEARIVLRRVAMAPVDRRLVQLLLEVPDVHAAYEDLRAHGVSFIHRPRPVSQYEQMELWSAAFRDPDGHGIAVTNWQPIR